jgi:hypothetical protein
MSTLAHVGGLPLEESLAAFGGLGLTAIAVGAWQRVGILTRRVRRTKADGLSQSKSPDGPHAL